MKKREAIIFDMDGTLYSFDRKNESHFSSSLFGQTILRNAIQFFETRFELDTDAAIEKFEDMKTRFSGEVSLGLEKEYGIPRGEYFAQTWALSPEEFVEKKSELVDVLQDLSVKAGVLSAAPKIWVERVLRFMSLYEIFSPAIFTGDPDIRKPDSRAFLQLAQFWQLDPRLIISIGDQEQTDILPAKSVGMMTVRIGKDIKTEADFLAEDVLSAIALLKKEGIV